jgi:cell division protein FtsW
LDKVKNKKVRKAGRCDFPLILLVVILTIFGVVMVFSASYYYSISETGTPYAYLYKQAFFAVSGFIIMMVFSRIDYHRIAMLAPIIAIAEIVLLLLIFTPLGIEANNAVRWLNFKVITVMPGELAKPALIIIASFYFSKNMKRARTISGLLPIFLYTGIVCFLILKQPNLSTAITVFAIVFGIAFLAGLKWRYVWLLVGGGLAGVYYLAFIDDGYQHERFITFLDPFKHAMDEGFQVVQSLLALDPEELPVWGLVRVSRKISICPNRKTILFLP